MAPYQGDCILWISTWQPVDHVDCSVYAHCRSIHAVICYHALRSHQRRRAWGRRCLSCIAGKMIAPVVEEYARAFPDVKFYKVDIDKDAVSRSVAAANVSAVVLHPPPS